MSIDALLAVLLPPDQPIENATSDWPAIEAELGTQLPGDYRDFIRLYGTGAIGDVLMPFNPVSRQKHWRLIDNARFIGGFLKAWKEEHDPNGCPYPLFPEPEGMLAWGHSLDGDHLFWQTRGMPDEWSVVVGSLPMMAEYYEYKLTMADFLAQVLARQIQCPLLPRGFPSKRVMFIASRV
jgi:hypothetical protein